MKTTFYYANSAEYGKWFKEVSSHCNLYMDWEDISPATRLLPPGKKLYICLSLNWSEKPAEEVVRSAIRKLRTSWKRIEFMELADEPQWKTKEIEQMAQLVRDECKAAKLPTPPLGCVFTERQILGSLVWKAKGLDWIGIEGYADYKKESTTITKKRVTEVLRKQAVKTGTKPLVVVAQAYDRNGAWQGDVPAMSAACEAAWEFSAANPRVLACNWFAYARPGGSRQYRELAELHKRLYNGS